MSNLNKRWEEYCYFLEATGFIRIPGYWNESQITESNLLINKWLEAYAQAHHSIPTKFPFIDISPTYFLEVMAEPLLLKFAKRYCGEGVRFDHGIGLLQPTFSVNKVGTVTESEAVNLHGGAWGSQGSNFCFQSGKQFWFGQLNIGIVLSEQKENEGGLCYIPGTHVYNSSVDGDQIRREFLNHNFKHPGLLNPALAPGDLIVFTEALIHGMAPWKSTGETRKNIYYKFSPGFLAWRDYADLQKYLPFAQSQTVKDLLRPPYVAGYSDTPTVGPNLFRTAVQEARLPLTKKKVA